MDDVGEASMIPIDPDPAPSDTDDPTPSDAAAGSTAAARHRRRRRLRARDRRAPPDVLAAIALGGMIGASARYGVAQAVHPGLSGFPWATFWTNLSGSLALGFLLVVVLDRLPTGRYARPFLATGVIGAYTTFSTFAVETDVLVQHGHGATAAAYVLGSLIGGVLAAWAGIAGARAMLARHARTAA
jgi:CrcB protein